jgi:hypothetical protein
MASSNPQNRKQRRAAAKQSSSTAPEDASSIPLERPPSSAKPHTKAKTLYELAAERQSLLSAGQPFPQPPEPPSNNSKSTKFVKISPDGTLSSDNGTGLGAEEKEVEDSSPLFDTIFLSITLSMVHFTLSVLTAHQYAQELHILPLLASSVFIAFPILTFLMHLMHGHLISFPLASMMSKKTSSLLLQGVYLSIATIAGCQLVMITNDSGYYAVMKRAPGIGTVWVWCVMEMGLVGALLGVLGPALWAKYNEYSLL